MDYREQYDRYVAMIEETIEKILPQTETDCPNDMQIPRHLCEAMRYSLLAGGKRGFSVGVNPNDLLMGRAAVAAPIGTW